MQVQNTQLKDTFIEEHKTETIFSRAYSGKKIENDFIMHINVLLTKLYIVKYTVEKITDRVSMDVPSPSMIYHTTDGY